MRGFNSEGVLAIYRFEMARALRTLWQSLVTPVITTALYFVVFGAAMVAPRLHRDKRPHPRQEAGGDRRHR